MDLVTTACGILRTLVVRTVVGPDSERWVSGEAFCRSARALFECSYYSSMNELFAMPLAVGDLCVRRVAVSSLFGVHPRVVALFFLGALAKPCVIGAFSRLVPACGTSV